MNIRNAGEQDVDDIARLEAACFSDPWPADLIARMVDRFVVATDDGGALFRYLALSTVLDEGSIDNVAVSPSMRRRGTADALVADAVLRARAMGLSFLTLEVRASNLPALRLYEKHGFSEVGRRRGYYEKPREDAILMTRMLKTC